jgi:wyosine [tRNA(Phe)-imidazoG37] synthetase (radical SAM superfamily)
MTERDFEQLHDIISLGYSEHPRLSEYQRLVYPVISRRSGGLSLGINLNPDKKCSFNCVYCQVDRGKAITDLKVEIGQIVAELKLWLDVFAENGGKYKGYTLKDISIAGDGEPTTVKELPQILIELIKLKKEYPLDDCKIILFTNASRLNRKDLTPVFDDLMANRGEIWCKFDFWDEHSFRMINRSKISVKKMLENIKTVGWKYSLTLQSCFFSWQSEGYNDQKYQQYVDQVKRLINDGVKIRLIQAYTLARRPADKNATAWSDAEMNQLTHFLSQQISVPIETYYTAGSK